MALDRRDFLKSLGLVGATSLAGCSGAPLLNLYSYLTPDENLVPGLAYWYATVCRACPAGCGILVRTREGRPVKLEGNPEHPVNRGALCARGQAFVQGLYAEHRLAQPLIRKEGRIGRGSWREALELTIEKLRSARKVGWLGGLESGAFEDVLDDFLAGFPLRERVIYEPLAPVSMARASEMLFSRREVPEIDLEGVDYLFSAGADFLDAWLSPVKLSRQWAEGHGFAAGRRMTMEYAGPRRNLTANAADRWHPIPPDGGVGLLRAIAAGLLEVKRHGMEPDAARIAASVVERAGRAGDGPIEGERLERIVRRLAAAERGLVLFGGADLLTADATRGQMLAMIINLMTGAAGSAIRFGEGTAWSKAGGASDAIALLDAGGGGEVDVLVTYGTDPAATLPGAAAAESKLRDAPFVLSLAWERSVTTEAADVVLPVHHPLESWGDYEVNDRTIGLMQPVRAPLYRTRHAGDLLIRLARAARRRPRHDEFKQYVVARRAAGPVFGSSRAGDWEEALVRGGEFRPPGEAARLSLSPRAAADLPAPSPPPAGSGPLLITPAAAALYDGRSATRDWLLEVPDSLTQTAWEIPLEIPPGLAAQQGIADGDLVRLTTSEGELNAKAFVNSGLVEGAVALRLGGGSAFAREAAATGNVMSLLGASLDPASGELARVQSRVALERIGPGALVSTSGGARSEGRYLYLSVGAADARAGRYPRMTRHGEEHPDEHGELHGKPLPMPHDEIAIEGRRDAGTITRLQEHPEHRWGLVVDLDLCTGCGACAVACYAENNIPVVGSVEVGRGRELSWIRLEKHVFGDGPDERWRFLPVMCQQCDNAPCETVCPVFASYHTKDGLNAQVYNRCVGTRYCSNNCPYKVRRFNYFDYERKVPGNQQLNPDVTVRSRGVMEKCTFCVQRIRDATNRAKTEKRPVRDGEIRPACVQTCPTGALVFGDYKRQDWVMSRLARDPRGYRLLDYHANTRPGVVYLRKVDPDPESV